jgi:hypothetical protein
LKSFILVLVLIVGCVSGVVWFMTDAPGFNPTGPAPALTDLDREVSARLRKHVETIARDFGTRGAHQNSALAQTADYVERELRRVGLTVERHTYETKAGISTNLEVQIAGTRNQTELVVVGAHMDSPRRSPGADANASGCAVLIEVARSLATAASGRSIRFVFFSGGEAPLAGTQEMGSRAYAKRCKSKNEKIVAMLALDGLGSFSGADGTQSYPFPFTFAYPSKGDFLAFVSDFGGRDLMRQSVQIFRTSATFPAEGGTFPSWMPGMSDTDSASFASEGYPSVLVTDTGTLRNELHGGPSDTFDRVDCDRMARVTFGLTRVLSTLANSTGQIQ